jgi:hypothetical protein
MTDRLFRQKKWKKAVPFETLAILLNEEDDEFSHSTAGYWKGNYGQDWVDMDVYNWMRLEHSKQSSGYNTASIPTITHEVRVLCLLYAQQLILY